jgi:hypothetical protein
MLNTFFKLEVTVVDEQLFYDVLYESAIIITG